MVQFGAGRYTRRQRNFKIILYDLYFAYGASAFLILDLPIARYRQEDCLSMNPQNQCAIKSEYLRIQSAHRTWRWWKEYLKLRLM